MKIFDKIVKDMGMNIFLVLHDSSYIKIAGGLLVIWLSISRIIWGLDFDKLPDLLTDHLGDTKTLRMQALGAIAIIYLLALVFVNLRFYKKWKKIDDLTPEEQKIFNEYFKTPSIYEKEKVKVF